jgi:hypothetical protein
MRWRRSFNGLSQHGRRAVFSKNLGTSLLKLPKCEIFHLFDFNDFYGIKSQIRTILSLLAYVPPTLATIFDFELAQKKLFQIPLRST